MIELEKDVLTISFPELHPEAKLSINFQRTLRIPDDGCKYPLPPGFGPFPLRHIDDYAHRVPRRWLERAGVIMPMYQREALWLSFLPHLSPGRASDYPFAVKVYTGKINAVTGQEFQNGLSSRKQDYLVIPGQPWLDGYCVAEGLIRQFVAMPLGRGYSAEEQLTGEACWGGIQIIAYPMDPDEYERRFPKILQAPMITSEGLACSSRAVKRRLCKDSAMGIAPGGRMRQEIYKDNFGLDAFDQSVRARCFVHILNSEDWSVLTGEKAPATPVDAKAYGKAGLPWFDYYDEELDLLAGSKILHGLKSVNQKDRLEEGLTDEKDSRLTRVLKAFSGRRKVREDDFWNESI